ncbi:MAG: hypothetical protein MAG453_01058 [Calditrichaeota bacterium]|nr:hypothetical protein [Calditrichota bacterium]
MTWELKRVPLLPLAKVCFLVFFGLSLIGMLLYALFIGSLIGMIGGMVGDEFGFAPLTGGALILFGLIGALFAAVMYTIMAVVAGLVYNAVASVVGGFELEFEPAPGSMAGGYPAPPPEAGYGPGPSSAPQPPPQQPAPEPPAGGAEPEPPEARFAHPAMRPRSGEPGATKLDPGSSAQTSAPEQRPEPRVEDENGEQRRDHPDHGASRGERPPPASGDPRPPDDHDEHSR